MWQHVLQELRGVLDVRLRDPARRTRRWRPEVWAYDGHQGPLTVDAPVVAQLHEAAWEQPETRAVLGPEFAARYAELSRAAAQRATRIVTPSQSSRQQIIDEYDIPAECIVVAPHGVDQTVFHPEVDGAWEVVARGGGNANRPYVVFVSQLHPRKNVAALLEAMRRLGDRGYPHAVVLVSGPPVDRDTPTAPESLVSKDSVVHLQGLSEAALAAVMAGADAFCLPSLMEGFGLTALEAMACGVPVVVSDRGALPEIVGDAGIVTEPTADAIEAALARLLDDDAVARALGEAGHKRAQEFTWERTARLWQQAIEEARAHG